MTAGRLWHSFAVLSGRGAAVDLEIVETLRRRGVEHWGRCSDPRVAAGALAGQAGGLMPRAAPASFENLEVGIRAALDAAGEEGRVVASSSLYLAGATRAQFSDLYLKQRGCWKPFPEQ